MTTLETRYVVDVVGDMQRLDGAVTALERSIRQFTVIRNEKVAALSDNALDQFAVAADNLCQALSVPATCDPLF